MHALRFCSILVSNCHYAVFFVKKKKNRKKKKKQKKNNKKQKKLKSLNYCRVC